MADTVLRVLHSPALLGGERRAGGAASREVAPDQPVVAATDLGVTRGDGIFEVLGVRADADGTLRFHALRPHLNRLARSARLMGLPEPDLEAWEQAVREAAAGLGLAEREEAAVKLVMTRGPEAAADAGAPEPTGWVYAWRQGDQSALRRAGLAVATMSRGYGRGLAEESPWLLVGAKTLAYALNRAAVREAQRRGAEEALFTTTDGYVLEGPTWTFVGRLGGTIVTVPHATGVLPGTTQASAFAWLEEQGVPTAVRDIAVDELAQLEAAWLMSSTRLAVPIRAIDGREVPVDAELTSTMNEALAARRD